MEKAATFRKPKTGRDAQFQKDKKNSANPEYIFETNRRGRKVKKKNPKYIPPTRKPDGSKLESTTSGSKKSQATAQQKVIDSKEYKEGLKKENDKYYPGDLTKKPNKAYYSSSLGRMVTGSQIKEKAKADRLKIQKEKEKNEKQTALERAYDQGKADSNNKKTDAKPKETEAEARAKWEKKSKNSPARRSGAWSDDELWEKQKAHRKWKSDRKEGKLKTEKFDPRKGKGQRRKLVQKTPAELAAEKTKAKLNKAKNDSGSIKGSKNQSEEEKKKKAGFNAERPGSSI